MLFSFFMFVIVAVVIVLETQRKRHHMTLVTITFVSVGDMGTPTRTRKQIDLPGSVLMQPRVEDTSEVEVKMKQIMRMSGLLTINGIVSTEF